jgi:5-carboxymethyl-2-hydroxymuconate isomerase
MATDKTIEIEFKLKKLMPHFVIDCSENILKLKSPEEIMQNVYNSAESTELFDLGDIKVRINPFQYYNVGNLKDDFIHIFGNILEGRTTIQKSMLSKEIIKNLKAMFPEVPILSINIRDFEKASYCNKSMV